MMKVFICWSGDRSMRIAEFLHNWLPTVHQNIDPFMSDEDIGKGAIWRGRLSRELAKANFGIVCLTPENLSAPWLHFEVGALSKIAESRVVPILFQLKASDVHGPLSDFQAAAALDNKEEMMRLLTSINEAMGAESSSNWKLTFEMLWDQVAAVIETIAAENKIQITSPTNGVLEAPKKHLEGYTYSVRGTLKYITKPFSIWLLNAGGDGKQWPQEVARHDPISGRWEGRIYLQKWNSGTLINAVVAPPTSQQLFEYYHRHGNGQPLSGIPDECENRAQAWGQAPGSK